MPSSCPPARTWLRCPVSATAPSVTLLGQWHLALRIPTAKRHSQCSVLSFRGSVARSYCVPAVPLSNLIIFFAGGVGTFFPIRRRSRFALAASPVFPSRPRPCAPHLKRPSRSMLIVSSHPLVHRSKCTPALADVSKTLYKPRYRVRICRGRILKAGRRSGKGP